MNTPTIKTDRLILRKFLENDIEALFLILKDIGYVKVDMEEHHDFGYGLRKEFWHRGIASEAGKAVVEQVKKDGLPYITATHDRNNPRSGNVMQACGMKYCYTYEELWQPKNFLVAFRMYQLNFTKGQDWIYQKYWEEHPNHFIEEL